MAKEYKDHGGSGRAYGSFSRIVFVILLITIGFLGWSYWVLLTKHRDASTKITLMKAELDSTEAQRAELAKLMESCKDELKLARLEEKTMKNTETGLRDQVKAAEEAKRKVEKELKELDEKLKKELEDCQESSRQEVDKCNTSCDQKVSETKRIADESCQQQQKQQAAEIAQASSNTQEKEQQNVQNVGVQQSPTPAQAVKA